MKNCDGVVVSVTAIWPWGSGVRVFYRGGQWVWTNGLVEEGKRKNCGVSTETYLEYCMFGSFGVEIKVVRAGV